MRFRSTRTSFSSASMIRQTASWSLVCTKRVSTGFCSHC
ncbi:hypothetical protein BU14_0058s0034 [Porphyra umbilicalis]|uniref:Uncharacterized protein n=1 Tax=Porphyra umbilicalis TaxID=2786 RepID=A0A1X6PHI9_PORUM|nr:hypothetical protein BU14_0058s0034 [Porphyra umbilicalis]|eukprot:OSX80123.1 hypothetical protein BU14_0058s0034 [Porphyra umbilicalis]